MPTSPETSTHETPTERLAKEIVKLEADKKRIKDHGSTGLAATTELRRLELDLADAKQRQEELPTADN